jgi:hypothetical protein
MPRKVLQCGGCFNAGSAPRIADLERLGFSIAIFPGGTARAAAFALGEYFASLKAHGATAPYRGRMIDFVELQRCSAPPTCLRSASVTTIQARDVSTIMPGHPPTP